MKTTVGISVKFDTQLAIEIFGRFDGGFTTCQGFVCMEEAGASWLIGGHCKQYARCMRGCMCVVVLYTVVGGETALRMMAGSPLPNALMSRKDGVVVNHMIPKFPGHCKRADTRKNQPTAGKVQAIITHTLQHNNNNTHISMEVEITICWKSSGLTLNSTNGVAVQGQVYIHERSSAWLFFSSSMLPIQQELGAASSNAQQLCNGFFQKTISVIMIGCGGIVVELSKKPEVFEP
jgi:hypothetical protein